MMPVMPVLANGGTYITVKARDEINMTHIESFLQTSALYLLGDQPCTPPASKRGPSLSQSTASSSLPDDIEEEFAKHRAHVHQVNNVVGDKITK